MDNKLPGFGKYFSPLGFGIGFVIGTSVIMRAGIEKAIEDTALETQQIIRRTSYLARPQLQTRNVGWGGAPEVFYDIDGSRVYLEIDGVSVEEYLSKDR